MQLRLIFLFFSQFMICYYFLFFIGVLGKNFPCQNNLLYQKLKIDVEIINLLDGGHCTVQIRYLF